MIRSIAQYFVLCYFIPIIGFMLSLVFAMIESALWAPSIASYLQAPIVGWLGWMSAGLAILSFIGLVVSTGFFISAAGAGFPEDLRKFLTST